MPQERLRSVVYRSFVTCENPRGVVEGKTIRINKTDPRKKKSSRKSERETQSMNSKEKEKMSLVEVKNGAQKLNEAIDSWSKGVGFRSQQKDIAKDLLKGALDLQESLRMLGKLQETSFISNLKKKEKPSEEVFDRIGSDRFESFRTYDSGFENERKLSNGSSRDCYKELRDVIRQGLSKQNLLPNKSYQESAEGLAGKRQLQLQLSPDIASTSTSRSSSMVYSTHDFTSSDSFSSRATEERSKGSNLIAKLMGLEEFPSKPLPSSPQKQFEIMSKMRPVFDVDLPNAKKPQFFVQKMNREHMTLDEIIETMQSKEVLSSNKQTIKRFINDTPPVVLMKPQRLGPENDKVKDFKVYENPIRKLHQEKVKTEDKANRGRSKSPSKNEKTSVPVVVKPQRKQETEKKVEKIQKTAPQVKRKPTDNPKSTNSVSKNSSLKPQRSALPNTVSKRIASSVVSTNKPSNQKKNTKIEKPVIINEVLLIDLPNQEKTQDSEAPIKEIDNVRQQSLSDTRKNHEESAASNIGKQKVRISKISTILQDSEPENSDLFQDCVNEFLEQENQRQNPWLTPRIFISDDHMMREIMKKVENLRNYSKFLKGSSNPDTVSGLLERDLYLNTIGGVWSITGWKDGCTVNEVDEVVLDLEKIVLSKLIDDIVMELVPYKITGYARAFGERKL